MIEKVLNKEKEKSIKLIDEISEVKLLMNADAQEDTALIMNAFPNSSNSVSLEKNEENTRINKLTESYGSGVYTERQVKEICMKYRLRFLPSTYFKGNVPIEAVHKLKEVLKNNKDLNYLIGTNSYSFERNLFIMAPSNMFNISSNSQKARDENAKLRELKRLRELDPALFIKLDNDKYLFVKEWGNSFSTARRMLGALTARVSTLNTLFFLGWLTFLALVIFGAYQIIGFYPSKSTEGIRFIYGCGVFMYFTISIILSISYALPGENGFFMSLYKEYRNDLFKVKDLYATEHNWNSR